MEPEAVVVEPIVPAVDPVVPAVEFNLADAMEDEVVRLMRQSTDIHWTAVTHAEPHRLPVAPVNFLTNLQASCEEFATNIPKSLYRLNIAVRESEGLEQKKFIELLKNPEIFKNYLQLLFDPVIKNLNETTLTGHLNARTALERIEVCSNYNQKLTGIKTTLYKYLDNFFFKVGPMKYYLRYDYEVKKFSYCYLKQPECMNILSNLKFKVLKKVKNDYVPDQFTPIKLYWDNCNNIYSQTIMDFTDDSLKFCGCLNLFGGMSHDRKTLEIFKQKHYTSYLNHKHYLPIILAHIKYVICDSTESRYEFFLMLLAFYLQKPGKRSEVLPYLIGAYGSGKTSFTEFISAFMGRDLAVNAASKEVFGEFSGAISQSYIFRVVDEMKILGSDEISKLLRDVTNDYSTSTKKFVDTKVQVNNSNTVITSNSFVPYSGLLDRRTFYLTTTDAHVKKNSTLAAYLTFMNMVDNGEAIRQRAQLKGIEPNYSEYDFTPMYWRFIHLAFYPDSNGKSKENPNQAFLEFLLNLNVSDFNPAAERPDNTIEKVMSDLKTNDPETTFMRFWIKAVYARTFLVHEGDATVINPIDWYQRGNRVKSLYDLYVKFCEAAITNDQRKRKRDEESSSMVHMTVDQFALYIRNLTYAQIEVSDDLSEFTQFPTWEQARDNLLTIRNVRAIFIDRESPLGLHCASQKIGPDFPIFDMTNLIPKFEFRKNSGHGNLEAINNGVKSIPFYAYLPNFYSEDMVNDKILRYNSKLNALMKVNPYFGSRCGDGDDDHPKYDFEKVVEQYLKLCRTIGFEEHEPLFLKSVLDWTFTEYCQLTGEFSDLAKGFSPEDGGANDIKLFIEMTGTSAFKPVLHGSGNYWHCGTALRFKSQEFALEVITGLQRYYFDYLVCKIVFMLLSEETVDLLIEEGLQNISDEQMKLKFPNSKMKGVYKPIIPTEANKFERKMVYEMLEKMYAFVQYSFGTTVAQSYKRKFVC